MKVYLHEIKETDREYTTDEKAPWVAETLRALDESTSDVPGARDFARPGTPPPPRSAKIRFNLRKVDEVIVVSGDIDTTLQLLCSRCASPLRHPIREHFTALYCKDKEMAGISYLDKNANPRGQNKGYARHAHDFDGPEGKEAAEDLEITYIAEEYLDLSQVLAEQVSLRIPLQPLCKEDCKGICANCGADLNLGRCACSRLKKESPFAALKSIKSTLRNQKS